MTCDSISTVLSNIGSIPEGIRDDVLAIIKDASRYALYPFKLSNSAEIYVSKCKHDSLRRYIDFFKDYSEIEFVYLTGSALTDQCRDKSDMDFLVIVNDGVDIDEFISSTPFDKIGYDDYILVHESEWNAFISNPKKSKRFLYDVYRKGVCVYESR